MLDLSADGETATPQATTAGPRPRRARRPRPRRRTPPAGRAPGPRSAVPCANSARRTGVPGPTVPAPTVSRRDPQVTDGPRRHRGHHRARADHRRVAGLHLSRWTPTSVRHHQGRREDAVVQPALPGLVADRHDGAATHQPDTVSFTWNAKESMPAAPSTPPGCRRDATRSPPSHEGRSPRSSRCSPSGTRAARAGAPEPRTDPEAEETTTSRTPAARGDDGRRRPTRRLNSPEPETEEEAAERREQRRKALREARRQHREEQRAEPTPS